MAIDDDVLFVAVLMFDALICLLFGAIIA